MRKQEPELRRGCEEVSLTDTAAFDCQKRMLVGLTNDSDCWRSVERLEFPPHDLSEARFRTEFQLHQAWQDRT
jgi:hypothetical protein